MTELEKMISGELYYAGDEQLYIKRLKCKDMCARFNSLKPSEEDKRIELINNIVGKAGNDVWIEQTFWCDYGFNIELGDYFYSNHNLVVLDCAKVVFGNNCLVGPNCAFYTAVHPLDPEQRKKGLEYAKPIYVGDDVWIGGNVVVLPGVTIGSGSVIGAGSVVTKDIPEGVVALGNPCRVVKKTETHQV